MAELERYLDVEGKYAWRSKKKVDDIVEQVPVSEVPSSELKESPKKPSKAKKKKRR